MTDNPNDPRVPDPGDDDYRAGPDDLTQSGASDDSEPTDPWVAAPSEAELGELPPLDDVAPRRRKLLSRRRVGGAAAALVLVVGGAAFALSRGGGDGSGSDGVASIDGNNNDGSASSGSGNGSGGDKPSQAEMEDAALKYAQCMRDHGIDMPDPKFDENGGMEMTLNGPAPGKGGDASAAQKKVDAADKACKHFLDDGAPQRDLSPEELAKMQDQQVKLAECMRDRGYDFPDPVVDANGRVTIKMQGPEGGGGSGDSGQTRPDPRFDKDMEECSKKAGMNGPGGGPPTRSSSDGDT